MPPSSPSILSFGGVLLFALQSLANPQHNQKPLTQLENTETDGCNPPQDVLLEPADPLHPNRNAEMNIYGETVQSCVSSHDQQVSFVEIPMDTCATANFTLDGRAFLGFHGLCEGWRKSPSVVIYEGSGCSGNQKRLPWRSNGFGAGHCLTKFLWDASIREEMASLQDWSIMFHCTEDESVTSETPKMDIAEPPPPLPPVEKPEQPRLEIAIVSDSACDISELGTKGHPTLSLQLPLPDICVNVAALHKLKIHQPALCPNGTEAKFAKWHRSGCSGNPVSVQEVDESLIGNDAPESCIEMGGKQESSYAFVCGGDVRIGAYAQSVYADEDEDGNQRYVITVNQQVGGKSKSGAASNSLNMAWGFGVLLGLLGFQLL